MGRRHSAFRSQMQFGLAKPLTLISYFDIVPNIVQSRFGVASGKSYVEGKVQSEDRSFLPEGNYDFAGLLEEFGKAAKSRNRNRMISILLREGLTSPTG